MYGMTKSGKLISYQLTEWLLEPIVIQYQCQMSIYYEYAPDGKNIVVLSHVYYCVYWYKSESLGNVFWTL